MSGHFGGAPRPWRASPNNTNACSTVHDAEGVRIGTADSRHAGMDAPAIAILFAAAPELAEALEAMLDGFTGDDVRLLAVTAFGSKLGLEIHEKCDRLGLAREKARAALAKAGVLP